jgi:hypothetical protein
MYADHLEAPPETIDAGKACPWLPHFITLFSHISDMPANLTCQAARQRPRCGYKPTMPRPLGSHLSSIESGLDCPGSATSRQNGRSTAAEPGGLSSVINSCAYKRAYYVVS